MAWIFYCDNAPVEVSPRNGIDFQLDEIKEAIGDVVIEIVPLPSGRLMVCDDDYLGSGKPLNIHATRLLNRDAGLYGGTPGTCYPVLGDVLVCEKGQIR